MTETSRSRTPSFRFGQSGNADQGFTFAPGSIGPSPFTPPPAPTSGPGEHLLPPNGLRPWTPRTPRTRLSSSQFQFGQSPNHDFTFGDGRLDASAPSFGMGELRDALPGQESGQFSLRLLHNATPLPSREPSPQPAASPGYLQTTESSHVRAQIAAPEPRLLLPPSEITGDASSRNALAPPLSGENSGLVVRPRNRTSDVSDISDMSYRGEDAPPYDVRDEGAPAHRFFSAEFQNTLQDGLRIARETAAAVRTLCGLVQDDENVKKLLRDAERLCSFQGSDTRTIGVLGDSGEGKSSLINSLLHFPGIAKTSDLGSACTSVVTEYRQKTRNHRAPITIEVEHLSPSEIEEVIKELLWSYRQLYLPETSSNNVSSEDYIRYERESAQAWCALEAAFKHKRGFREEKLQDMADGALERLTEELIQWAHEIEWPDGDVDSENSVWRSTANTAAECVRTTAMFMQDRYWPFTKIIRVYLNAQVLKTGLVLADLPGLQDTNLARVRATQDYLFKCNHIFIVAKISRAITDQSLKSSLFSVLSRHVPLEWEESAAQSLKIAVVCTMTENIDIETATEEFCGPNKLIRSDLLTNLNAQIDDANDRGNRPLKKALKQQREILLTTARSIHVATALQRAYAAKAPRGHLDVFCVSNAWYGKYARKAGRADMVKASGIPALRQFCYGISADAQLAEARHFLAARLVGVVGGAGLWVRTRLEGAQQVGRGEVEGDGGEEVEEVVEAVKNEVHAARRKLFRDFWDCFEEQILKIIDNRHPKWEEAAGQEAVQWRSWHHTAWCHNNGSHSTPKRGRVDWNAKIAWKMRTELEFQWDIVEEEIGSVFQELLETAGEQFQQLKEAIWAESALIGYRTQLMRDVDPKAADFRYRVGRVREEFAGKIRRLRRYASESSYNSYILDAMIPTYRTASAQSGRGRQARQIGIVEGRITDGVMFPGVAIELQTRMNNILWDTRATLGQIVIEVMNEVKTNIGLVLSRREAPAQSTLGDDTDKLRELMETLNMLKTQADEVCRAADE